MQHHKITWDNGFAFESNKDGAHTLTLNSTVLRYGLFENMELRVGTDFLMYNNGGAMEPTFGIAPLCIGTKSRSMKGMASCLPLGFWPN